MTETTVLGELPRRLKAARIDRGLSLDGVAKLSGVSRSMVSQIERGVSSPTVATLWNLTQALGVDFAGLLDGGPTRAAGIEVLTAGATPSIENLGENCRIRILSPPEAAGKHEVYEVIFGEGGRLDSQPHGAGAREQLTVIEGRIAVASGGARQVVGPGDTARYPVDVAHMLSAEGGPARGFLIVLYDG